MPFVVFVGHFLAGAALALAARWLPEARTRLLYACALAALAGIVAKALLASFPGLEMLLDGVEAFVWIERDLVVPFGVAFFAVASRLVPDPRNKRATGLMPFVLLLYLVVANTWTFTRPECYVRDDRRWRNGVCLQSTGYTCGAASCATVLRAKGVPEATEHVCAELSFTIPNRGVTDLGAARALRKMLPPGRTVRIVKATLDDLKALPLPCLAPTRYSFWFDHMVTVLAVKENGFLIGDPLCGPTLWKREDLEARWRGHVIVVD